MITKQQSAILFTMTTCRCPWADTDPLNTAYHDTEWGVPVYEDKVLFEFLILEGMQAGLSWLTILKKREHYRKVLYNFDAQKIARFTDSKQAELLQDAGIIRNRLKVASMVNNAKLYLGVLEEHGSFSDYMWQFVDATPIVNHWKMQAQVPITTAQSDAMSHALKKRGFKFVGSTICYAYMQAVGMVNDHLVSCYRHKISDKNS